MNPPEEATEPVEAPRLGAKSGDCRNTGEFSPNSNEDNRHDQVACLVSCLCEDGSPLPACAPDESRSSVLSQLRQLQAYSMPIRVQCLWNPAIPQAFTAHITISPDALEFPLVCLLKGWTSLSALEPSFFVRLANDHPFQAPQVMLCVPTDSPSSSTTEQMWWSLGEDWGPGVFRLPQLLLCLYMRYVEKLNCASQLSQLVWHTSMGLTPPDIARPTN